MRGEWHMNRRLEASRVFATFLLAFALGCTSHEPSPGQVKSSPKNSSSETKDDGADQAAGRRASGDTPLSIPPYDGPVWFQDVTAESGIDFRHVSGDSPQKPFPSANGSGVAAFDYDLDGQPDLYFATGTPFPLDSQRTSPVNRMYRQSSALRFVDVTDQTQLGHNGFSAGLAVGDYDADGFPDLYVTCLGPNCLFRNQGDGTFERVSAGVEDPRWGTSAAWLDYDEDGLLDLYVCNYAKWTWENNPFCGDTIRKVRMHCGPRSAEAEQHCLYHNRGDGTFEDSLEAAGLHKVRARGQGVVAADINQDGHVDLYVGNDLNPNFLFLGDGTGRFDDATLTAGSAYDGIGQEQASMGVDVADVNADGRFDLFVTNYQGEYNTLYENVGGNLFQDATSRYGLVPEALAQVGWGTAFVDFNLDGALDLIVTNGHVDNFQGTLANDSPYQQPPLAYRGGGKRFKYLGAEAGEYFKRRHAGRGLAIADFDNDGDQDVVIGHQDDQPALLDNLTLRNRTGRERALTVRLVGTRANRDAVGATVVLRAGQRERRALIKGGGSYLSASETRLTFAILPDETELALDVHWPGGAASTATDLQPGQDYMLIEPMSDAAPLAIHRREVVP